MAFIEIGQIVRPQGLRGAMKVLSYLESPERLAALTAVHLGWKRTELTPYGLKAIQRVRGGLIVTLEGVGDRDAALRLVGATLWMPRAALETLPEDEYYWQDLIGLQVVTEEGKALGGIVAIFPTGSNDVFVCRQGDKELLLPAIGDVVRRIDPDEGVMVVRLVDGLEG